NGGEVREPQRRRLVGDAERVPEILDRNISSFLPLRQVRQRRRTRDQARRGEVGDLQPLPKEVRIGGRLGVAENSVPNCLQGERTQTVPAGNRGRGKIDPSV